jgi:hypothetical protein
MLSINQIRFCRKYFIISLTYAAGKTNKNKLAELKPVLQLVKVSSDKEEEEEYAGGQIAKESRTMTKHNRPLLDMSAKKWYISTNESY